MFIIEFQGIRNPHFTGRNLVGLYTCRSLGLCSSDRNIHSRENQYSVHVTSLNTNSKWVFYRLISSKKVKSL